MAQNEVGLSPFEQCLERQTAQELCRGGRWCVNRYWSASARVLATELLGIRGTARRAGDFAEADRLRGVLERAGFEVRDEGGVSRLW